MHKMSTLMTLILSAGVVWAGAAADRLSGMDQATRENAVIDLEWIGAHTEGMTQAEYLWNSGKYAEAISAVEALESEMGDMCLGISWRKPIETEGPKWGTDVQVTGSGYDVSKVELVKAMGTNNLFVVAYGTGGAWNYSWWTYISTNGGTSWSQTYEWGAAYAFYAVDAAESDNGYVYIAYGAGTVARVRRIDETTGAVDAGFGYKTVHTTSDTLVEINAEPNRVSGGPLYIASIDRSGALLYSWSNDGGSTWNAANPTIANAERGLDMDCSSISAQHYLWLSYINTSDSLCAAARSAGAWEYHNNLAVTHSYWFFSTAIAHHGDSIIIFYENPSYTLYYRITYNDGANWSSGGPTIYADSAGSMDVTGRGGVGWHMSFSTFSPSAAEVTNYSHRTYSSGAWDPRQPLGDHDAFINYKTSIDYLGAPNQYGVVYIDDNFVAWFDRLDWSPDVAEGTKPLPMEFKALPGMGRTTLSFVLPQDGFASLKIYDVKGALVNDLSGNYKEGLNRAEFVPSGSGTFFAILVVGDQQAITRFVSVK